MIELKVKLPVTQDFTGNGSQTDFTLQNTPDEVTEVLVAGSSVAYTFSGKIVKITTAPASGAAIKISYKYWTLMPTVAGEDGKSAYQAALSAGYTGTEAAFNSALASIAGKQATITANGLLKGNGSGTITAAQAGTDYVVPTGSVSSATKLTTARAIKIGNSSKNFDGSGAITYTLAEVGASPVGHTHSASEVSGVAPSSHNHGAGNITAGTLGGSVVANASAVTNLGTKQVRNIYAGTNDIGVGAPLPTGDIYIVYEA